MEDRQVFFEQLNSFFDHIYVITLARAKDRQQHVQQELQGLRYEFFFGRDKHEFSLTDLQQKGVYSDVLARRHHRYGKELQIGQVCVSWSHADVYRDVLNNNYQRVLIMEDDVVIDREAANHFSAVQKELPAGWELLYLGFAEREKAPPGVWFKKAFYHLLRLFNVIKFSHATINHLYPKKVSEHIYQAGYHDCIHAYGITKSAAEKMLALQQPISFIADNLPAHAATNGLIKGYVVLPKIIHQQYQVGKSNFSYLNQ